MREQALHAYHRADQALLALIRGEQHGTRTPEARRRRATEKLRRTRTLLDALGNPQERYPVVHVTGTSGKGSTCASIAAILDAAGYRVGLKTSPYLQVATEKLQIGSALIDPCEFAELVVRVLAAGRRLYPPAPASSPLGYAEVWTALSYLWFAEQRVDVAVVEVGAGGRFDSTNVISPVVSVVTSVGLDHLVSLGPTLADIAWHKAGIIKPGSTVVIGELPPEARTVVEAEAARAGALIQQAGVAALPTAARPGMPGDFQWQNAAIATEAVRALTNRGIPVSDEAILAGLSTARLPGRLERMPGDVGPVVWIDGAHNGDKIAALAREAKNLTQNGQRPVIVLGLLRAKDAFAIASALAPVTSAIVTSQPSVIGKRSRHAADLASELGAVAFRGTVVVEPEPELAILRAREIAATLGSGVLVTGSLYLAGQVRRCWYPDDEIVWQRTPWPATDAAGSGASRAIGGLERQEPDDQGNESAKQQVLAGIHQQGIRLER